MNKLIAVTAPLAALVLSGCVSGMALRLPDGPPDLTTRNADVSGHGVARSETARAAQIIDEAFGWFAQELGNDPGRIKVHVFGTRGEYEAAGGAGDGLYLPGSDPRIVTFAPVRARVLRHEVAHHFVLHLVGALPEWINEGVAEYLETIRAVDGRPYISGLVPEHLDSDFARRAPQEIVASSRFHHSHLDYARAWSLVSHLLENLEGTIRERLLALRGIADRSASDVEASFRSSWRVPERWVGELESILVQGDPGQRLSASRVLGRLGRVAALSKSVLTERVFLVRLTQAAELARAGEKSVLRSMLSDLRCLRNLAAISRSAGREFDSADDVRAWLDE